MKKSKITDLNYNVHTLFCISKYRHTPFLARNHSNHKVWAWFSLGWNNFLFQFSIQNFQIFFFVSFQWKSGSNDELADGNQILWLPWFPAKKVVKDYYIDGQNTQLICFQKCPMGEGSKAPKLHPRGGFFEPWFFIILKNSHQDLSNEGSNFVLSSLEVGHWVAQT